MILFDLRSLKKLEFVCVIIRQHAWNDFITNICQNLEDNNSESNKNQIFSNLEYLLLHDVKIYIFGIVNEQLSQQWSKFALTLENVTIRSWSLECTW